MKKIYEDKQFERDLKFAKHEIVIKITTVHSIIDDCDVLEMAKAITSPVLIQKIEVDKKGE